MNIAKSADRKRPARTRRFAAAGFTLTELIVAMFMSMIVCGSLTVLVGSTSRTFRVQPEAGDLLQRARVGHELLLDELSTAGAGPQLGHEPQPLAHWLPPVLPYARATNGGRSGGGGGGAGVGGSDPEGAAFGDRITLIAMPDRAAHALLDGAMASPGGTLVPIVRDASCGTLDETCGFASGQRVVLFDSSPAFDISTVISPPTLRGGGGGSSGGVGARYGMEIVGASKTFRATDDARIAVARVTTFSFDPARHQLRRSTGDGVDEPTLDNVVELSFRYFADPYPPEAPRPPPGEANCLFETSGVSRLPVLTPDDGSLIELPLASFTDGPFCGVSPYRFDADLYRIRRVHVRLRVQTASTALRGRDPLRFRIPGQSAKLAMQVPDMTVEFDITPRNLQMR